MQSLVSSLSCRVFGHFEKPLFFELCKYIETKFVPANALLFRPGQVGISIHVVYDDFLICLPLNISPSIVSDSVIQRQFRTFVKSAQNTDQILVKFDRKWSEKKKHSSRSGKSQGILFWVCKEKLTCWRKVRENWNDLTRLIWYTVLQSNLQLKPPLVSDHFSLETSFQKYQTFPSQITILETSCKWSPLVSDRDHF